MTPIDKFQGSEWSSIWQRRTSCQKYGTRVDEGRTCVDKSTIWVSSKTAWESMIIYQMISVYVHGKYLTGTYYRPTLLLHIKRRYTLCGGPYNQVT